VQPTRLRAFQDSDIGACLSLFDSNVPTFFAPQERAEFDQFLRELPSVADFFVIELGQGEIAACGGLEYVAERGIACLCWGMVRRDLHGRGLGKLLTQHRLDAARRKSEITRVAIDTSQHTAPFYEKFGFAIRTVSPDGYGPGLDRHDMELQF
jgi:predicted N-acetyltransferase YhbS